MAAGCHTCDKDTSLEESSYRATWNRTSRRRRRSSRTRRRCFGRSALRLHRSMCHVCQPGAALDMLPKVLQVQVIVGFHWPGWGR